MPAPLTMVSNHGQNVPFVVFSIVLSFHYVILPLCLVFLFRRPVIVLFRFGTPFGLLSTTLDWEWERLQFTSDNMKWLSISHSNANCSTVLWPFCQMD